MTERMTMRAVGYIRVSDDDQLEGYSMDAQRRAFYDFCAQKGWEVVGVYVEDGHSAWAESSAKRPAFRQILTDATADKFDVVVSHTLDRFSRNLRVMLDAFHVFAQHSVTYASVTQDIDYSTPEGKLFMTMLGAFAQYFSDALSGHTKKGMRERAMQGMFNGEPPFGYERCDADCIGMDETHTGCHIDPVAGPEMLKAFERYGSGSHSYRTVAEELNRKGFRTKGTPRPDPDTDGTSRGYPETVKGGSFHWVVNPRPFEQSFFHRRGAPQGRILLWTPSASRRRGRVSRRPGTDKRQPVPEIGFR